MPRRNSSGVCPKQGAKPRREVAVAGKARVQRNRRQVGIGIEHSVQRPGQSRAHHVLVHGHADFGAKHMREMAGGDAGQIGQGAQRPPAFGLGPDRFPDALDLAQAASRVARRGRAVAWGDTLRAGGAQGGDEQADAELLRLQRIHLATCEAPHELAAREQHCSGQQRLGGKGRCIESVASQRFGHDPCQRGAGKPQRQASVADAPGKADAVRLAGRDQQRMSRRGNRVLPRAIVLFEHTGQRQRHNVQIRDLDLAALARRRARDDVPDLQQLAIEQGAAHDRRLRRAVHREASGPKRRRTQR